MSRKSLLLLAPVGLMALLPILGSKPAPVGAPWISMEIPANPLDQTTRGAAFLVHAYYHENPARFPAVGTAEGLVDGKRQSIPLEFTETSRPGVYAVKQQWPSEGHWVLAIGLNAGGEGPSLMVQLGPNGGLADDRYYREPTKVLALTSVRVVRGKVNGDRIDTALRTMAMKSEE